jgi:hypothetical protein
MPTLLARALAAGCLAAILAACDTQPAAVKKTEPPPEPLTGENALFKMYQVARATWARDITVERMTSMRINGIPEPTPGKSNAWEAVFNSATKGGSRSYTQSVVEQLPDLHKGVFAGPQQASSSPPFLIAAVKTDTDVAYEKAIKKLTKAEMQRTEGKPLIILLEMDKKFPDPVWRILWGESVSLAAISVFIDANTGEYLTTMH